MAQLLRPQGSFCKNAGDDWTWEWAVSDAREAKYPGSRAWMQGWSNPIVQIRESEDASSDLLFTSVGDDATISFAGHDFGESVLDATDFSVPIWTWFTSKESTSHSGSYEKKFLVAQVDVQGKTTTVMQEIFYINPEQIS